LSAVIFIFLSSYRFDDYNIAQRTTYVKEKMQEIENNFGLGSQVYNSPFFDPEDFRLWNQDFCPGPGLMKADLPLQGPVVNRVSVAA